MNVCVQWPRFGPYHLARLRATHALLKVQGARLTALETMPHDTTYGWVASEPEHFEWVRVASQGTAGGSTFRMVYDATYQALTEIRPDAVAINSYSLPDALACLAWCRHNHRTAVVMTDSKADDGPRSAWREGLKARIVRSFDAALLAGTPQMAYFRDLGFPASCIFLPYDVVDNDALAAKVDEVRANLSGVAHLPGLNLDEPYFVCVSRYLAVKNLDGLLRAYYTYRSQAAKPWRLVLVGDGALRPELERLIAQKRIEGVTLTGFVQMDALAAYYARAAALVHPTLKDTWGLAVNEAMATGLPVLVSRHAGCAIDLVEEGENGWCFDPTDESALAALLERIASTPAGQRHRMGQASQRIVAAFTPQHFAQGLWEAIRDGSPRARRGLSWIVRLALFAMRVVNGPVDRFHAVRDA